MLNCKIDNDLIRVNLENHVANLATNSGLFERLDNHLIIPIENKQDIIDKALSYKDKLRDVEAIMLQVDPIGFLKYVNDQVGSTIVDSEGEGVDKYPVGLVNLATRFSKEQAQESFSSSVDYSMDAISKLQSEKGQEIFEKGKKNNWDLSKILTELQVQKTQKELILTFNTSDKETILNTLISDYSYPVEIETATELGKKVNQSEDFTHHEYQAAASMEEVIELEQQGWERTDETIDGELMMRKLLKPLSNFPETAQINTSHYGSLTVPGGTNYTENEISTPDIVPSIKGHAQFSTDNGIGWFRSDEQVTGGQVYQQEEDDYGPAILETYDGTPTKTRRILEVQSDLYQKGRNLGDIEQIIKDLQKSGELKIDCN